MPGPAPSDLARAQALLQRTADLIAAMEAEVLRLRAENEERRARILAWEATLRDLLPETAADEPLVHVEGVHDGKDIDPQHRQQREDQADQNQRRRWQQGGHHGRRREQ